MKCPNYQDYPYRNQKKDCYNFGGGWKTRTWSVYRDLSFRIDCVQDLVQTTEVDIQTNSPEGGTVGMLRVNHRPGSTRDP